MSPLSLLNRRNEIASTLNVDYEIHHGANRIMINEHVLEFPLNIAGNDFITPDEWIATRHGKGKIHEPGMIAWLLALAESLGSKKVRFVDAGALYGYFSLLSEVLFENIEIVSIEANPKSARAVSEAIKRSGADENKYTVANCLLSDASASPREYVIQGFSFYPLNPQVWLKVTANNLIKKALNILPNMHYRLTKMHTEFIEQKTLAEFISSSSSSECTQLVKVDAEGFQAVFLPPATPKLIEVGAIVLLEFDSKAQMAKFGITNAELCKPFLDAGYNLYWVDHRVDCAAAVFLTDISDHLEINSLAVLIPGAGE